MAQSTNRRTFIKQSLAMPAAALAAGSSAVAQGTPVPGGAKQTLPLGKVGSLEISRMLLGGNLLTHFTHSRDLKYVYNLAAHYNTDEKIIETLALAEQNGINTLVVHTVPAILNTLRKYREEMGGKIQWIICTTAPITPDLAEYRASIKELVQMGTEAIYLWGVHADKLVADGQGELMAETIAVAKELGVPSGLGAHDLRVVEESLRLNIEPDFYIKTFHHHNYPTAPRPGDIDGPYKEVPGYWCSYPEQVKEVMAEVDKPWMAFKVMAAGAIPPQDAFQYAFDSGADHVLAGMFDFEIEEDVRIMRDVLGRVERTRPWCS